MRSSSIRTHAVPRVRPRDVRPAPRAAGRSRRLSSACRVAAALLVAASSAWPADPEPAPEAEPKAEPPAKADPRPDPARPAPPRDDEPRVPGDIRGEPQLLRIYLEGMITDATANSAIADVRRFRENYPDIQFIVFQLDTPGGEVEATQRLANFIFQDLRDVRTIAFIPPGRYALSGGALLAVAANEIVMGTNSHMGGAAPVTMRGVEVIELGEKAQAPVRAMFRSYADARGYPTVLTSALVSKDHEDVFKVTFSRPDTTEFLLRSDLDTLSDERKLRRVGEPQVVLRKGELLVMTEREARDFGFAKHIAEDLTELRNVLNLAIGDENVLDSREGRLKSRFPLGQAIIDFFNQPIIRFLLILGGCLGILIEFKTFGLTIPGTFAAICFAIFFLTSYFPVTGALHGTADVAEIIMFLVGAALVALEFLLLPGTAIFALLGAALCGVGLVLAMVPPGGADPSSHMDVKDAIQTLGFALGAGFACFLAMVRFLPHNPLLARRGLVTHSAIVGVPTAESAGDAREAARTLIGKKGTALTPLRPAGKMETEDGELIDVVTDGDFIERGTRIAIRGCPDGRVLVARIEAG